MCSYVGSSVLLLATKSSSLVRDGIVLPATTFSPSSRVAFALLATTVLLSI